MRVFTVLFVCTLLVSAHAEKSISITAPQDDALIAPCTSLLVTFDVQSDGEAVRNVRLYVNGSHKTRIVREPWEYTWENMVSGRYELQAKLTMNDRTEIWSEPISIRVGPVSHGEVVMNGGFDCGQLEPWSMNVNASEGADAYGEVIEELYFDDVGYLFIDIINRGGADWHVQLQQNIPVDSGHVYTVSFLADADDQKTMTFTMQENQDPWAIQFSQEVTIDGLDLYGPFEFVAQRTDPSNHIRFNLATDTTPVYFDNIRIIDHSLSAVRDYSFDGPVQHYELNPAYPNPFNLNTTIPFSLSRANEVTLSIYNMQGQRVKTLVNGPKAAGAHRVQWDGSNEQNEVVPSGIYFYRLTVSGASQQPIDLSRKLVLVK